MMPLANIAIIDTIVHNLGLVGLDQLVIIITVLGMLIFFAKDVRLGIVMLFFFSIMEFVLFNAVGYRTDFVLIMVFASVVLMAISLLISYSRESGGGII
jgi:hypothetical protein